MPSLKYVIKLSSQDKAELMDIVTKGKSPARTILRANILLARKKRETPPVPAKVTGEVEAHVIALACGKPPKGYSKWTLRLLANKAVELGYIDSISHVTVSNILKKTNLSLI